MSGTETKDIITTKEQEYTRSHLTQLKKQINPFTNLNTTEEKIKAMELNNEKRNDRISQLQVERNALLQTIHDTNLTIDTKYSTLKTKKENQIQNEIQETERNLEREAKTLLTVEIEKMSTNTKLQKEKETKYYDVNKRGVNQQREDKKSDISRSIKINYDKEIQPYIIKMRKIENDEDYKKGLQKKINGKKTDKQFKQREDEIDSIKSIIDQIEQRKNDAIDSEMKILTTQQEEQLKKVNDEFITIIKIIDQKASEDYKKTIQEKKEQIRIEKGIPSHQEKLDQWEIESKKLTSEADTEKQRRNEQNNKKRGELDNKIKSLVIDTKIDMIAFGALENEKNEIIKKIEGVVQTKTEIMHTTLQEKSGLSMILGTTQHQEGTPGNQTIIAQNIEKITNESSAISDTIFEELDPDDKKAIESAILNHLKNNSEYKAQIGEIIVQGSQSGKSVEEIKKLIDIHNKSQIKKLIPVFIIEIEQGNIIVTRENGNRVALSQQSSEKLAKNESYKVFKKLYEQFIENPLLDLTDLNYLSREGIAENTATGLESQLINAVGINRDIENFLFNDPQANPESIHDDLQSLFNKPLGKKQQQKIAGLLGKTLPKDTKSTEKQKKQKQEEIKTTLPPSRKNDFLDNINTFTTKRINQSLLLGHCATLRETFGLVSSQGTRLVDAISFDFKELSIAESGKNISQDIVYQNLTSKISIDGRNGKVTMPNTLASLRGIEEISTITTLPVSFQQRKEMLTKAATLTETELLNCNSWSDVQTRITENIRRASEKNQSILGDEKNKIAENLEKESLIMNFTNFMSGSIKTKNTEQINKNMLSKSESNQNSMKLLLEKRTQGKEGTLPMNLQELKTINQIFMNKEIQTLVGNQEGIPSDNRDTFMEKVGFYKRGPDAPFTEIIKFFSSLEDMAHSQVNHEHESGYQTMETLLKTKEFSGTFSYTNEHKIIV